MVSLSFFSEYRIPTTEAPIPFDVGAIFLTPVGIFVHSLWGDPELFSLYFRESLRSGVFTKPELLIFLVLNTLVAYHGLRRISR